MQIKAVYPKQEKKEKIKNKKRKKFGEAEILSFLLLFRTPKEKQGLGQRPSAAI